MNDPHFVAGPPPEAGHEERDIDVKGLLKFGAGMLLLALIVHFSVAWLYWSMADASDQAQKKAPPLVVSKRPRLPRDLDKIPAPRLQQSDAAELRQVREEEKEKLKGIDEAMRLLADPETAAKHGVVSKVAR